MKKLTPEEAATVWCALRFYEQHLEKRTLSGDVDPSLRAEYERAKALRLLLNVSAHDVTIAPPGALVCRECNEAVEDVSREVRDRQHRVPALTGTLAPDSNVTHWKPLIDPAGVRDATNALQQARAADVKPLHGVQMLAARTAENERIRTTAGKLSGVAEFVPEKPPAFVDTSKVKRQLEDDNEPLLSKPGAQADADRAIVDRVISGLASHARALDAADANKAPPTCGRPDRRGMSCMKPLGHTGAHSSRY